MLSNYKYFVFLGLSVLFSTAVSAQEIDFDIDTERFWLESSDMLDYQNIVDKVPFGEVGRTWSNSDIRIDWDDNCNVTVLAILSIPNLTDEDSLSLEVAEKWRDFFVAVNKYENFFLTMAHMAGVEISRNGCPESSDETVRNFNEMHRELRLDSNHGDVFGIRWD